VQARSRGFPTAATPSDPHLEREHFVYKWQVFLGGIASATFVLAGAATPALAQTVASSPLTNVIQSATGAQVTGDVCTMAGLPLTGEVNSAVAGVTGQSCTGSNTAQNTTTPQSSSTPASTTPMTTALPGLSAVTGEIPGLSSMSSALPALNSAASQAPAQSPASSFVAPNSTPLSNATVPSLGSNELSSGGTVVQNAFNGVTGTLPVSSLTGGLPNLGDVTGALSGVTGPQN
jgi:hypothetical protein